jgi:membrane protein involved in colicin uptake
MNRTLAHTLIWTLMWVLVTAAAAEKIYTWTDNSGVTHITPHPPPPDGRLNDVLDYTPTTEAEREVIKERRQSDRDQRQQDSIIEAAREARRRADDAKSRAAQARQVADEKFQQAEEFKTKTSNTIRRWQVNKSTRLRLEAEAANAQKEAQRAAEEAARLEKEAKAAEEKAKDLLTRPEPAPKVSTDAEPQPN